MTSLRCVSPVFIAIVCLIAFQILFVTGYVGAERQIYFWDHAMYFDMARQLFAAFQDSWGSGWAALRQSMDNDYNLIFALPSVVSFGAFGATRTVFIVTNFMATFLPFEIAAACVMRRIFGWEWREALAVSLITAMLVPPLWLPLLEGYPDTSGAAAVAAALALLIGRDRRWRAAVLVGLALAAAVLLRRHFLYPVLALVMVAGAVDFERVILGRRFGLRLAPTQPLPQGGGKFTIGQVIAFYVTSGLVMAATIYTVAPGFFERVIAVDYVALYASYKKPAGVFVAFMFGGLGLALMLAVLTGFVAAWRMMAWARRGLGLVAGWFAVWLVMWCAGSSMAGHHYMLHAVVLAAMVGLAGCWAVGRQVIDGWDYGASPHSSPPPSGRGLAGLAALCALLLIANSVYALWFAPTGVKPNSNGGVGIFSAARPPVVRKDYETLAALGRYLIDNTKADDRIYVVASSFYLNQDLLARVFADALQAPGMVGRFQWGPEIDGEQPPPLDVFASSNIYVVASPAQYHLDPAGQTVVTAAAAQFPPPAGRAKLFTVDPQVFSLEDGVEVRVWRRERWTPELLQEALADIRKTAPGAAQDWVAWQEPRGLTIRTDADNRTNVHAAFDGARPETRLFFDRALAAGQYRLGLDVMTNCEQPRFSLAMMLGDKVMHSDDFAPVAMPGRLYKFFNVQNTAGKNAYVQLQMNVATQGSCGAQLQNLQIDQLQE